MSRHQVADPEGAVEARTIYAAGLYAVSERDLGIVGVEYRVTHTPTGMVVWRPWRALLACEIADALNAAFPTIGADLPWGATDAYISAMHAAGNPSAAISAILNADNPHGEPPPNPCPTCGRAKETP